MTSISSFSPCFKASQKHRKHLGPCNLTDFEGDEYHSATAKSAEETRQLLETGFECVRQKDDIALCCEEKVIDSRNCQVCITNSHLHHESLGCLSGGHTRQLTFKFGFSVFAKFFK